MKSNSKILLSLFAICLILVGCGKKDSKSSSKENNEEKNNIGKKIEIKVNSKKDSDNFWTYELAGDDIIVMSYSYDESECQNTDICDGKEVYTLTAIAPGEATLNLKYVNPSDQDNYLLATYEIVVDDKLNISEKHSGTYFEQ